MASLGLLVLFFCSASTQAAAPELSGDPPEDFTGFADSFQSLECNIDGGTTYEWFHNGTTVKTSPDMFYTFEKQIFMLERPITNKYQGTYQCKASNDDGTLLGPKINVFFSVVGKFYKTDRIIESKDVTVGKDLALTCPPRTLSRNIFYHWGGRQGITGAWFLPQAKHYMIMEDGTLLFANVRDQDLEYFNVVKNGVSCGIESKGTTKRFAFSQKFLLIEAGVKNETPFGPTIKTKLEDQEVAKGEELVVLRCGAVGLPTPDYSWTFENLKGVEKPITSGQDGYDLQDFNHVLKIKSIDTKHDGWYKCSASSNYSNEVHVDEKTARLSVKGKPQWAAGGELSDEMTIEDTRFSWLCEAYGNPDPTYTWLKNGEKLLESNKYEIDGGEMTFTSIAMNDQGLYQCVAENEFGNVSSSAVLTVETAPTTQPPDPCTLAKRNLMFLVDGSGSVPPATFREFKKFMSLLVGKFDVSPDTTHVGVLQYSSKPKTGLEFHFSEHQTLSAVQDAISKVKYHYGAYTFGGYAMNLAQQIMNHYDRTDAKNVWVMLMDNGLWDKTTARKISKAIRQSGTKVIVLDTENIMDDLADQGLDFSSEKLEENVEEVRKEICK